MPIPTFTGLGPEPQFEDVVNKLNRLTQEVTNIMLNLDSLNVVSLTADHVDTGTLDANLVTVRSDLTGSSFIQIDGEGIRASDGVINTFEIDTTGKAYFRGDITSEATITGSLIQTATTGRRLALSGNEFIAYDENGTRRIAYEILDSVGSNDFFYGIKWYGADGLEKMQMQATDQGFFMGGNDFNISSNVFFNSGSLKTNGFPVNLGGTSNVGAETQADSTATTVDGLKIDFNSLLAKLRNMAILG
jgi:hypothetical protein